MIKDNQFLKNNFQKISKI